MCILPGFQIVDPIDITPRNSLLYLEFLHGDCRHCPYSLLSHLISWFSGGSSLALQRIRGNVYRLFWLSGLGWGHRTEIRRLLYGL